MSECRRTAEQLAPYVDGDLAPAERAHVEQHLSDCPPCRRAAEETQGGRTLLRRSGFPASQPVSFSQAKRFIGMTKSWRVGR